MSDRELATDVYVHPPEGGPAECLKAGTKESDLPEWIATGKARNWKGEETDQPLMGDDVWVDPDAVDPTEVAAGAGDDGFTFGLHEPLFVETETDEVEANTTPEPAEKSKPRTRR